MNAKLRSQLDCLKQGMTLGALSEVGKESRALADLLQTVRTGTGRFAGEPAGSDR
jgi:hypothetical protein